MKAPPQDASGRSAVRFSIDCRLLSARFPPAFCLLSACFVTDLGLFCRAGDTWVVGCKLPDGVSKNDESCIKNEKLCIKDEEFCIENDKFCRLYSLSITMQTPI